MFKDFQYDLCLDIKSNGVNVTTKLNTKKDGWLTRASGVANELLDGQYHEIIMTYNSNSGCVSIYLDQKLIASEIWGGELVGKNQDIYLGSGYWNNSLNQGCTCSINDVKIYNYAITMGE